MTIDKSANMIASVLIAAACALVVYLLDAPDYVTAAVGMLAYLIVVPRRA